MNKPYWDIVESLQKNNQSILIEDTTSYIGMKTYALIKKAAKHKLADIKEKKAREKLEKIRNREIARSKAKDKADAKAERIKQRKLNKKLAKKRS